MITALERQPYLMKREQKKAMEVFTESVISCDKKEAVAAELIIIIKLFSLAVADDDVFTEEFFEKKFLDTSLLKRKWGVQRILRDAP